MSAQSRSLSRRAIVCLVGLSALALGIRLWATMQTPHPLGADGYYYVTQIKRLFLSARLHTPESSWVIYFLAAAHAFVDSITALKIGAALLATACVPAAFLAGRALNPHPYAAWFFTIWAAASPTLSFLAAEFPKNVGVIAPLLVLVFLLKGRTMWVVLAIAMLLIVMTAHRTGAVIVGAMLVGAGVSWWFQRQRARPRWVLYIALASVALFGGLAWLLPNLLHPSDLERITSQLDLSLGAPAPFAYFELRELHWLHQTELVLPWLCAPLGIWLWIRSPKLRPIIGALLLPLLVFLMPIWRRDVLDLGYRLSLLTPLLGVLIVVVSLPALRIPRSAIVTAALLATVVISPSGIYSTALPPYERYRSVIERIPRPLPDRVIAHRGINFYYGFLTEKIAVAWAPEPELDRTKIFRLAWGIRNGEWIELADDCQDAPRPVRLDPSYTWVREDVWECFVKEARATGDDELIERIEDWMNPGVSRPQYLLRNW